MEKIHIKNIGQVYMGKKLGERNKELKKTIENTEMGALKGSSKIAQILCEVFGDSDIAFLDKLLLKKGYKLEKIDN